MTTTKDYETVKDTLFDTSELEAERLRLQEEMNVVAELIEQCVNGNAHVALDQTEYQKKYDGPLTGFNADDWYSLVEYATVDGKDDIRFTFKNGMEVKA